MAKTKNESKKTNVKKKMDQEVKKLTASSEPKKIITKEVKKISAKEELKKVSTKKIDKIETLTPKKIEHKKSDAKIKKASPKKSEKKTVQKVVKSKKGKDEKKAYYEAMSLGDCIHNMQLMNVPYDYEDYTHLLLEEGDLKKLEKTIIADHNLNELTLDYKIVGYDIDIIPYVLNKVADTMDITAAEFKNIKKMVKSSLEFTIDSDAEVNAEEYLKEFHICEKILMIAQRKGIDNSTEVSKLLGFDIMEFSEHVLSIAYAILPTWQYRDVVFYEDFMSAYLSQYTDLYNMFEQRLLLDCADLYIMHGDYQHGDDAYGYILRENQIKDYIYYRYASVYVSIDMNKAKAIAQGALQYVDDRFEYHSKIIEILNY